MYRDLLVLAVGQRAGGRAAHDRDLLALDLSPARVVADERDDVDAVPNKGVVLCD